MIIVCNIWMICLELKQLGKCSKLEFPQIPWNLGSSPISLKNLRVVYSSVIGNFLNEISQIPKYLGNSHI